MGAIMAGFVLDQETLLFYGPTRQAERLYLAAVDGFDASAADALWDWLPEHEPDRHGWIESAGHLRMSLRALAPYSSRSWRRQALHRARLWLARQPSAFVIPDRVEMVALYRHLGHVDRRWFIYEDFPSREVGSRKIRFALMMRPR